MFLNNCGGNPINIGISWKVYSNFNNGVFIPGGAGCGFSQVGSLVEVATLSNPTDCDTYITVSAHFVWENYSEPAFKLTYFFDPSYGDNTWQYNLPYAGSDNPQFSIIVPANTTIQMFFMFSSNGGFSGTLSFDY